jgi:hypothetical protein
MMTQRLISVQRRKPYTSHIYRTSCGHDVVIAEKRLFPQKISALPGMFTQPDLE